MVTRVDPSILTYSHNDGNGLFVFTNDDFRGDSYFRKLLEFCPIGEVGAGIIRKLSSEEHSDFWSFLDMVRAADKKILRLDGEIVRLER